MQKVNTCIKVFLVGHVFQCIHGKLAALCIERIEGEIHVAIYPGVRLCFQIKPSIRNIIL